MTARKGIVIKLFFGHLIRLEIFISDIHTTLRRQPLLTGMTHRGKRKTKSLKQTYRSLNSCEPSFAKVHAACEEVRGSSTMPTRDCQEKGATGSLTCVHTSRDTLVRGSILMSSARHPLVYLAGELASSGQLSRGNLTQFEGTCGHLGLPCGHNRTLRFVTNIWVLESQVMIGRSQVYVKRKEEIEWTL